mmetsp:Transcript_30748/g.58350  ORF Transcript_30748/g.58350 Transcript_30748/m.58350 type:complete len:85 (-) Transcript_30748:761-1015(-)
MYRGDSMYSEQSLVELGDIPCKECKHFFVPKTYLKHFGMDEQPKFKSVINQKKPVFNYKGECNQETSTGGIPAPQSTSIPPRRC